MLGEISDDHRSVRIQPKSMDVLLYLAEKAGTVAEREELLLHVWGERAQSDEPLTRCIGELRKALGDTSGTPQYIKTIPKRGYMMLKAVVGASADTVEQDPDAIGQQQAPRTRGRSMAIAIVAILLLGIAAWLYSNLDRTGLEDPRARVSPEKSIVVLPFVNMSPDPEQEYFSDGIAEELLTRLSRIPDLRVISRTSAFSYKGKDIDIRTIAEQLNVAHVLEGSVRKSGGQLRITAQLIDARTDSHLWSETYEHTLEDIFATQDQIAVMVVHKLKSSLNGETLQERATDPEAYILLLQARHLGRQGTPDAIQHAITLLEHALEIDPDYAAALEQLAAGYIRQADHGLRPIDEGYTLAREATRRALDLDPGFAPAHLTLGRIALNYDRDLQSAALHYERAFAIDPTSAILFPGFGYMALSLGQIDKAVALAESKSDLNPWGPVGFLQLGIVYYYAGRLDEAIASLETTLTLSPDFVAAQYMIGKALLLKGEPESALAVMQQEVSELWRLFGLAEAHHALGQTAEADAALAHLLEKYATGAAYNIAYILAFRDEADRAFEWLEKAVTYNDPGLAEVTLEPMFTNIHSDPRWLPFLERIGKSPRQLAAIEFNVTVPK